MEIDKKFLEKSKANLTKQYNELLKKRRHIDEQILEIKGAYMWLEQTIKLINK